MVTLEPITPALAFVFKTIRLRALQDSPTAFSSTYERESKITDEEWLQRSVRWASDGSIGYIAYEMAKPCGLVICYAEAHDPPCAQVLSMWVDPAYRRAGVGRALIEALAAWAKSRGLHNLKLMVTSINRDAVEFYQRIGFRMTGRTEPYPNDPTITQHEMLLSLRP